MLNHMLNMRFYGGIVWGCLKENFKKEVLYYFFQRDDACIYRRISLLVLHSESSGEYG